MLKKRSYLRWLFNIFVVSVIPYSVLFARVYEESVNAGKPFLSVLLEYRWILLSFTLMLAIVSGLGLWRSRGKP